MQLLNKRGQFFLIAALIIITIIFSFSIVYISAGAPTSETEITNSIAKDIKYESVQLINQGVHQGSDYNSISYNLTNFTYYYSKAYPMHNMTFIMEDLAGYFALQSKDGNMTRLGSHQFSSNVSVSLNNPDYTFNITTGYDFYVIIQKQGEYETYIATA